MISILKAIRYRIANFLFEQCGIPKTQNEKISKVALRKHLPKNPVMVDCGAHDGEDSVELLKKLGGTVHCFEPVNSIYKRLEKRKGSNKNMFTYEIALSDSNGSQEFYVSEGTSDASSSLLPPQDHLKDHPGTLFKKKIVVTTKTLDSWAAENSITKIDLLWLDMQGFEMNMLKASHKILDTVTVIHTEVSTRQTYKGVAEYEEYRSFLESKGFKVMIEAIPEGWDMGNVLFVRK
jgi:FkbM family methyltransferase